MAMTVQYSVKYIPAVITGVIIGAFAILEQLPPEQPCHFLIVGLKI